MSPSYREACEWRLTEFGESDRATVESLRQQARLLSRKIGAARQQGHPCDALLEQHRSLIARARRLAQQLEAGQAAAGGASTSTESTTLLKAAADFVPSQTDHFTVAASEPLRVDEMVAADAGAWDAFVHASNEASLYHLSGWRQVCTQAFGHSCPYLIARQGQTVVGVLPLVQLNSRLFGNFLVSLPFFNYGGALCNAEPVRKALLDEAVDVARKRGCSHLELRDITPIPGWSERTDKITMKLDLPASPEALWQQLGSKLRAQIKKAQSHGLTFETGGVELLGDFYRVFAENMRDLGTPVYSQQFFRVLVESGPGEPRLVVGRDASGAAVSVALLVQHGGEMEIPWASTLRRANPLSANMALYWHVLTHACEQRCVRFDFGRCTQDSATHRFKKQWGAKPAQLRWHYWMRDGGEPPRLNPDNPKFRLAVSVWKRLPVWLTRLIGPHLVKYLP